MKHLTKAEFLQKVWNFEANPSQWIFAGERPAVVDFYASWCGPCMMLAPILDELADEYAGKVDFYKVDTENENDLALSFNIRSIPTLMFCDAQNKPRMLMGVRPKAELREWIDGMLKQ